MLNDCYRRASVYVQASAHEGFGLSVAEGMLAGLHPGHDARRRAAGGGRRHRRPGGGTGSGAARGGDRRRPSSETIRSGRRRASACSRASARDPARGRAGARERDARPGLGSRAAMTVNLFSDTQTRPTEAMRRAMAQAEVGDEQRFDDPTVNALQERVARAARQGGGAASAVGHDVQRDRVPAARPARRRRGDPRPHVPPGAVRGRRARRRCPERCSTSSTATAASSPPAQVEAAVRPAGDRYGPRSRLVSVEQTTNIGGGRVWPLETMRAVVDVASRHGLRSHLDGARLMNAVVASGVPGGRSRARLRHGLDGLHQGPRCAGRRGAGRVARADRRGVALQADDGRRDAPGRRRWRPPRCTRSTTTWSGSPGPRQRAPPGRRAGGDRRRPHRSGPGRDQHRDLRGRRMRTGSAAGSGSAGCSSRRWTRSGCVR